MDLKTLADNFGILLDAPDAVENLRRLVIDLAISGKLVEPSADRTSALSIVNKVQEKLASRRSSKANANGSQNGDTPAPPFAIPTHWVWTQLNKLGLINPRNDLPKDLEVSFIPMRLVPEGFKGTAESEARPWGEIKNGFTHFAEDDVALAKITPCFQNRKSCVLRNLRNNAGAGTTELHIFRPVEPSLVSPDYVLLYLKSAFFVEGGVPKMTGTAGQKRVPNNYFSDSPFPLPPTEEQHRIVAKVDHLMQLCDDLEQKKEKVSKTRSRLNTVSLEKLVSARNADEFDECWGRVRNNFDLLYTDPEKLRLLQKAVYSLAISGRLTRSESTDTPAEQILKAIVDSAPSTARKQRSGDPEPQDTQPDYLFPLPKNWIWTQVGTIGLNFNYGTSEKAHSHADGVPVLRMNNISDGRVELGPLKYVKESLDGLPELFLQKEDLLFNRTNSYELVGKTGIFLGPPDKYTFASYLIRFRCRPKISPYYVSLYFQSAFCRLTQIEPQVTQQTNQANFNGTKLKAIWLPLPPPEEQGRIVQRALAMAESISSLINHLKMVEAKQEKLSSMMAQMLTDPLATHDPSAIGSPTIHNHIVEVTT